MAGFVPPQEYRVVMFIGGLTIVIAQWWGKHHIVRRSFKPALILVLDFNGDLLGDLL